MLRAGCVRRDERQVDRAGGHAGKLDFRFFSRFLQALHRHLIAGKVDAIRFFELADHPVHDALVEIVAAEAVVARRGENFLHAVAHLNDGNVECTAAEVVNHDLLLGVFVDAVGKRRGRRLVDDTLDVEPGDLAGVLGGLTLCIGEVSRNGNDGGIDFFAEVRFRVRLQLLKDHRRNFLRSKAFVVDLYFIIGTHLALDGADRAIRVRNGLTLRDLTDHALAGF